MTRTILDLAPEIQERIFEYVVGNKDHCLSTHLKEDDRPPVTLATTCATTCKQFGDVMRHTLYDNKIIVVVLHHSASPDETYELQDKLKKVHWSKYKEICVVLDPSIYPKTFSKLEDIPLKYHYHSRSPQSMEGMDKLLSQVAHLSNILRDEIRLAHQKLTIVCREADGQLAWHQGIHHLGKGLKFPDGTPYSTPCLPFWRPLTIRRLLEKWIWLASGSDVPGQNGIINAVECYFRLPNIAIVLEDFDESKAGPEFVADIWEKFLENVWSGPFLREQGEKWSYRRQMAWNHWAQINRIGNESTGSDPVGHGILLTKVRTEQDGSNWVVREMVQPSSDGVMDLWHGLKDIRDAARDLLGYEEGMMVENDVQVTRQELLFNVQFHPAPASVFSIPRHSGLRTRLDEKANELTRAH